MNLEDLIPENPTFFLKATGKTYELRPPNLEDRVVMSRVGDLNEIFKSMQWDKICKVIYVILKDKSDFLAQKETIIDEEGIQKEALVIGPIRLLRAIANQEEAVKMLSAFNAAVTASEPLIKDYVANEVKKNLPEPITGQKSMNTLPQNTDSLQKSSENSLSGKSLQ